MKVQSRETSNEQVERLRHAMHELNNALTPVLANAQLARMMIATSPSEAEEALDDVVEAASRANVLVAEMRAIVRVLGQDEGASRG